MIIGMALAVSALACGRGQGDNANSGVTAKGAEGGGGNVAQGNMTSGNNRATLTGCLAAGDTQGTYVLRLAAAGDASGGASGNAAANEATTAGRAFLVVPESGEDLSANMNKRVAVDGFIENRSPTATSGTGTPAATATSGATGASGGTTANLQVVRARSVRHVADSCLPAETAPAR